MYDVSAQGVDERMINVHCYYYYYYTVMTDVVHDCSFSLIQHSTDEMLLIWLLLI